MAAKFTHDEFRSERHFAALDGLRAIAALMVVLFHFGGPAWNGLSGWIGVHMFFVLSGFLITTLALREEAKYNRVSIRNFFIRRVFRIFPVYFVVLALVAFVFLARHEYVSSNLSGAMPYYLSFLNEYAPHSVHLHSWTLGIEQKFYLFWPLLAFGLVMSFARRLTFTLILALGIGIASIAGAWGGGIHYFVLLVGCVLAIVMHSQRGFALVRPLMHPVAGIVMAIAFVLTQALVGQVIRIAGSETPAIAVYSIVFALLLPSLIAPGTGRWLLSRPLLTYIGDRSYSLYLVQFLAFYAVTGLLNRPIGTVTGFTVAAVSLVAADVLYRWVELPMIKVGRRLVAQPVEAITEAQPVANLA